MIVVSSREDPERRSALIASGVLAVVHSGTSDEILAETFASLLERRRESLLSALGRGEPQECRLSDFAAQSPAMQSLLSLARKIAHSESSLLLLGETGSGKERPARAIHNEGPRASGPLIAINCAAIPDALLESELFGHEEGAFTGALHARRGQFELAHGGTLFLDEIGEMPLHLQAKLLRVLQERRIQRLGSERPIDVDVRIMAASNKDLELEVEARRFRADLYYRLAVVTLTLPPLRERRADILELLESYLSHFARRLNRPVRRFSPEALEALMAYERPGNVRELANVVERAVLLAGGEEITLADIPLSVSRPGNRRTRENEGPAPAPSGVPAFPQVLLDLPFRQARRRILDAFELWYLEHQLRSEGGRIDRTARRSGLDPRSVFEKMRRLGLRKEDFRPKEKDEAGEASEPGAESPPAVLRPGRPPGTA